MLLMHILLKDVAEILYTIIRYHALRIYCAIVMILVLASITVSTHYV